MFESHATSTDSRQIRVFLSSTFVDFMEERELLVKRVFPALNRRARDRVVELIDVDLRWGVTEEQTKKGLTLPLCLGEIDRCRPYFIGLLGERHGWVPPADFYQPELLERQPWLRQHQGGASVTELEILHGVLRNPEMAGHAFFYLRDPAYALAKKDPTWLAEGEEERQRLQALKEQVRASRFPVVEGLPDPEAIASRIEADLWELIEERFPEQEQPDALEQENRKHASYRHSRTGKGQYIGGEGYIEHLEGCLKESQQQILIQGESGSGKSALIANWMHQHALEHPGDVVYAHHLGCTNDANALRPLLGRLIDTASQQLLGAELISEALAVPENWWELVAKVTETLRSLGRWCEQNGKGWIWVLDGLDRLDPDDQNALPWLPLNLPAGVQVVASALASPAREILSERGYTTLTIQPLEEKEQEQLIQRYLQRYTKELDGGLRQQILAHPLSGSPLFLKVLLEELRQCGRHDTLKQQLEFYLSSQTVDDLYERVLERLETDGNGDAVKKVMEALWASRAGLTEPELLAITDLKQLQWAPIDLALEKAFGRNGNRLVFDHDFMRIAVQDRYLPTEEQQRQAHSVLADCYQEREGWDERDSEELPWQLQQAGRLEDLRDWLLVPGILAKLQWDCGSREVINYWLISKSDEEGELDELIAAAVEEEIEERKGDAADQIWFVDRIAALLDEAGLYRELLLRLRSLSLELREATEVMDKKLILTSLSCLASAHKNMGHYDEAEPLYLRCLEACERWLDPEHPDTLTTVNNLGQLYMDKGDYAQAEAFYLRAQEARERVLGPEHPDTLVSVGDLAILYIWKGDYEQAEGFCLRTFAVRERLLGPEHPDTLIALCTLGLLYKYKGDYAQAEAFYKRDLEACERLLGSEHPSTLTTVGNLACLYRDKGDYEQAEAFYKRDLEASERLLGPEHPSTLRAVGNLACLYRDKGDYEQAEAYYNRVLSASKRLLGPEHPYTLSTVGNLGLLNIYKGDYEQAEAYLMHALEAKESILGSEHPETLVSFNNCGLLFTIKGEYEQAESLFMRALMAQEQLLGWENPETLITVANLGGLYRNKGDYEQAEAYYKRALAARERLLGPENPDTNATRSCLANLFSAQERYGESVPLRRQALDAAAKRDSRDASDTLTSIHRLAQDLYWSDELQESEQLYREALAGRIATLGDDDGATMASRYGLARCLSEQERYSEAIELRRVDLAWCQANDDMDTKDMLISMHGLGCDLLAVAETEEALEVLQSCLGQRQKELGACDDDTLTTLDRVLEALSSLNRQKEALALSQATQEALTTELGENHPEVLTQLSNQASLHEELGELDQAETLYLRCLAGREEALGADHATTLTTAYNLAFVLSQQDRRAEAIPLRRRELAWCRQQNGNTDPGTLSSINDLAIDLREIGELEEAETLFRELVTTRQQVLEPGDFQIGRALGGLAKTLEEAGNLEEALTYNQQALDHRLAHEGPDAWWTNRERLDLARVLGKLGRDSEAMAQLQELQQSMGRNDNPNDDDRELIIEAAELLRVTYGGKTPEA